MEKFIFVSLLILQMSCSINNRYLDLLDSNNSSCESSTLLEKVLAVTTSNHFSESKEDCLRVKFQTHLNKLNAESHEKKVSDIFDYQKVIEHSSFVEPYTFTTKNIVDLKPYIKGREIFAAYRKLISTAEEEVLLQTYTWESPSEAETEILEGLKQLETNRRIHCPDCKPVIVRIIADYGPTLLSPLKTLDPKIGPPDFGHVARQSLAKLNIDPKFVDIRAFSFEHKAFGTNHAKSLVVDGQVAMITGANIQPQNDVANNWYDVGYMVGGEVAKALRQDFLNALVHILTAKQDNKTNSKSQAVKLAIQSKTPFQIEFKRKLDPESFMQKPFSDPSGLPIVMTSRNGSEIPSFSNHSSQNRAFQALFQGARKIIRIQTPNFNDDAAIRGLGGALRNGVKVHMILSRKFNCSSQNAPGQGGQNQMGLKRLLKESSLPLNGSSTLHDFRWFSYLVDSKPMIAQDNMFAKTPQERRHNSHAKFMAVDDEVVAIGSANMDTQSWNQSREINLLLFHKSVTEAWQSEVFLSNQKIAQPVQSDEFKWTNINCNEGT